MAAPYEKGPVCIIASLYEVYGMKWESDGKYNIYHMVWENCQAKFHHSAKPWMQYHDHFQWVGKDE